MIRRDEAIRERLKEDGIRHESSEFEIKMINLKSLNGREHKTHCSKITFV